MVKYVGGRKKSTIFLKTFKPGIRSKVVIGGSVYFIASHEVIQLLYMYKTTKLSVIKLGTYQVYEYGLDELHNLQ